MKLSDQAMGAIMMALQKSLAELTDIVPILQSFDFQVDNNENLVVQNPPNFKLETANVNNVDNSTATIGSD